MSGPDYGRNTSDLFPLPSLQSPFRPVSGSPRVQQRYRLTRAIVNTVNTAVAACNYLYHSGSTTTSFSSSIQPDSYLSPTIACTSATPPLHTSSSFPTMAQSRLLRHLFVSARRFVVGTGDMRRRRGTTGLSSNHNRDTRQS